MWQNAHQFQSAKPDDRDTRIDDHPAMLVELSDHAVAQTTVVMETIGELKWKSIPTYQTEKQVTISDMQLFTRVRSRYENSHLQRVEDSP